MHQKRKKYFKQNEIIFHEGDIGDCAYIIEKGQVEIYVKSSSGDIQLAQLGPGEFFGEISVIDGSPRSASAVATQACELITVSSESISERVDSADPIVRMLVSTHSKRTRSTNHAVKNKEVKNSDHSPNLNIDVAETQKVIEKMRLEMELKQALPLNEFRLFFQPIVNINDRDIVGFEALIRWNSKKRGMVPPNLFIGVAEETSLIIPIGKWVIETACKALGSMNKEMAAFNEHKDLFISINLSGQQLKDPDFFDHLIRHIKKHQLSAKQIKLEITERVLMEGHTTLATLDKCRTYGFPIALDDFGTGYSSLNHLTQICVDDIKIDKQFVKRMLEDTRTYIITQSIISLARELGVPIIAEGIEEEENCSALQDLNCEYGQGYLFSRPVPFENATKLLLIKKNKLKLTS